MKVAGDSMTGIGLFTGDIAIVNRAKTPVGTLSGLEAADLAARRIRGQQLRPDRAQLSL